MKALKGKVVKILTYMNSYDHSERMARCSPGSKASELTPGSTVKRTVATHYRDPRRATQPERADKPWFRRSRRCAPGIPILALVSFFPEPFLFSPYKSGQPSPVAGPSHLFSFKADCFPTASIPLDAHPNVITTVLDRSSELGDFESHRGGSHPHLIATCLVVLRLKSTTGLEGELQNDALEHSGVPRGTASAHGDHHAQGGRDDVSCASQADF